jgi:hypothetical protein
MRRNTHRLVVLLVGVAAALLLTRAANAQWTVSTPDGKSTLNLGFLSQMQFEELESADASYYQQNLFFRRLRLIAGGRVNDRLSFFLDTDTPNLGKGTSTGSKNASTVALQDFVLTYTFNSQVKLDGGMLLLPMSHNGQQGATSLLAVDYGPYTFLHSDPLNLYVGRDYGLQARGYLARNHFEYRAGVSQGNRGTDARASLCSHARAVWYPLEADTGLFYTGTTLGKRRIAAFGASVVQQQGFRAWSGDVFLDLPLGGDALTCQFDFTRFDGGRTFSTLPRQDAYLVEGGYYFQRVRLGPFVQYGRRDFANAGSADESKLQAGLSWWGNGHKFNLKLGAARLKKERAEDRNQVLLQSQVLMF